MPNPPTLALTKQPTGLQKGARSLFFRCIQRLQVGTLTIIETFLDQGLPNKEHFAAPDRHEPYATIEIHHPQFYARLLKGGSIAAGEAYMDGWWSSPNLTVLMELMARNLSVSDGIEANSSLMTRLFYKVSHWLNHNSIAKAQKNIHAHYDLGNELYYTFLDSNMLYSCALFLNKDDSLEQAQLNKMDRLCQQLQLKPSDHVIEIGTGWGAMAIYMAKTYGCHVTTTTISEEQHHHTAQQIAKHGLQNRVTLLKADYRLLEGQYDKLVSIEMIEAVGKDYLPSYIKKCQSLLKPNGLMAIQAITIADQRYDYYSNNVDFIQKYIFPGGFLPSITALTVAATKYSDLVVRNLFDLGTDYAKTLAHWRHRFEAAQHQVLELGYDEKFIRMWRYYFCYCEGGFLAKTISTVQMTLQRPM